MRTLYYNKGVFATPTGSGESINLKSCVATIGFFDGVHRGHQFLIRHLVEAARNEGMESTIITFDEHPRKVLQSDYQPEMLSTLDSKLLSSILIRLWRPCLQGSLCSKSYMIIFM